MTLTAKIREMAASGPVTAASVRAEYPKARSVPQALQHLERRGELVAERQRGRGHLGTRKVYRSTEEILVVAERVLAGNAKPGDAERLARYARTEEAWKLQSRASGLRASKERGE